MNEWMEKIKPYRKWIVAGVVVLVVLGAWMSRHKSSDNTQKQASADELVQLLGVKGTPPEKLKSFKSVEGVLAIQHWETANGARVYYVPVRTLPMVNIACVFDAGASRNGSKGGLAYLTNELLAEGTKQWSADQIAQKFDEIGTQYEAQSQRDMALVSLRSLSYPTELSASVKTLAEVLSHPTFPETGFKREQQNMLVALKQQSQLPQHVAGKQFYSLMYGKQPYANWILGEESTVKSLNVKDVANFYQKFYVAQNAAVVIVGDVSANDAEAIAQVLTRNLATGSKAPDLPEVANLTERVEKKIDFPSAQTHILIGVPGIKRQDPDYYALMVGNHILGGNGSVTRIFDTVRNQHGLAYSANSYFIPMRERGPFILSCQTRNDKALDAENMLHALLKEFIEKGPTDEELDAAKRNLLGGYALNFSSNADIAGQVSMLAFYNLDLDYFNQYKAAVEKLSAREIRKAFQRRISPDKVVVVKVGGKPDAQQAGKPIEPATMSHHGDIKS